MDIKNIEPILHLREWARLISTSIAILRGKKETHRRSRQLHAASFIPMAAVGRSLSTVKMDYFGKTRSASLSIGAHHKYTVQFVVPSSASYLKIWAYKDTATSQFIYVDDFQLVQD